MGIRYQTFQVPDLYSYDREYNEDGTEKHIMCEGARYHVLSYSTQGVRCSEPKCEMNRSALGKTLNEGGK